MRVVTVLISAVVVLGSSEGSRSGGGLGCDNVGQCQGAGWVCVQGKCDCGIGYIREGEPCVKVTVGLHDNCNTSSDCAGGRTTQCLLGVCMCNRGYRPAADKQGCVPQVALDEKCNSAGDCRSVGSGNTVCWQGVCSCPAGFRATPDGKDCVQVVIGAKCGNNRECYVNPNTRSCIRGVCDCAPTYVPSKMNNNTCLKVSTYNTFCEEDHQCVTENTRCAVPKCVCKAGHRWDASRCVLNSQEKLVSKLYLTSVLLVVPLKWL